MLYVFGFDRLAVVISDLFFQHPSPPPGEEGPEHGVRVELRRIEAGQLRGSIYSARPIAVAEPLWRVDLLESVEGPLGSFDRTHHHPRFTGWDESARHFDGGLSADPFGWLERRLSDLPALLTELGAGPDVAGSEDATGLHAATEEIMAVVRRILDRVRAGDAGRAPEGPLVGAVRASWL
jgi:hypothetical protein